jgi:hypothetical protein
MIINGKEWQLVPVDATKEMSDDDRIWTNAMVLAERDKEIDRLRSLVDGAMDIVELWKAETQSQIKWRADWLAGARDAVGSRP